MYYVNSYVSCRKNKPLSAGFQAVSVCVMYYCNRKKQTPKYCNNFIFNFFSTSLIVAMKMKWSALMTQMVTKMMRTVFLRLLQYPMQKKVREKIEVAWV